MKNIFPQNTVYFESSDFREIYFSWRYKFTVAKSYKFTVIFGPLVWEEHAGAIFTKFFD